VQGRVSEMGVEENGLTLEGLANRLEALQRENAENAQRLQTLEQENETLRTKVTILSEPGTRSTEVAALRGSDKHWDEEPASESSEIEERVSRKWLLSKAGAAAVGTVAAGALLLGDTREARASHRNNDILADLISCHNLFADNRVSAANASGEEAVYGRTISDGNAAAHGENLGAGPGVWGESAGTGPAVEGTAKGSGGTGVKGTGRYGVWGESNQAGFYGVTGRNTRTDGTGVRGIGAGTGVRGESINGNGHGVYGKGKNGVFGESSTPGQNGVSGQHTNQGAGVSGVGRVGVIGFSHENGWNAVWGRHTTNGRGVAGDSAQGVGVLGESTSGIGGQFQGGKAQLRIVPKATRGRPTTGAHAKGELYMDSAGTLFVCTIDGTPGTWRRFATAVT
jgi:hypothetical protein